MVSAGNGADGLNLQSGCGPSLGVGREYRGVVERVILTSRVAAFINVDVIETHFMTALPLRLERNGLQPQSSGCTGRR